MRRFAFRLQRVLGLKGQLLQAAKRQLGERVAAEMRVHEELRAARQRRQEHLSLLAELQQQGMRVDELAMHRRYQVALEQAEIACATRLEQAQEAVATARGEVARRRQDERMLEVLRERRLQEHEVEQARAEQAELDEMAGRRQGDRSREGNRWA